MKSTIRATYNTTGVENLGLGKQGLQRFVDVMENGEHLIEKYDFAALKVFKNMKLLTGEIIEFEAEVNKGLGGRSVQITRPSKVRRVDEKGFSEAFEYCINKFLKLEKKLTKKTAGEQRMVFSRLVGQHGSDLEFWKFVSLPFQLNTLHWFLRNPELLVGEKKKFEKGNIEVAIEKSEIVLEENKIGEKVLFKKKQGLMDFMS